MSQRFLVRPQGFLSAFSGEDDQSIARDQTIRAMSFGMWGCSGGDDVEYSPFVYHLPDGPKDYAGGGICQATGYWSAKHGLVIVDGAQFIDDFAPDHVNKPGP